jgi:hypothetical protein
MCTAGYRIALPLGEFIADTRRREEGSTHTVADVDELTVALRRLLGRGILTVLEPSDIDAELLRRERSSVPELVDDYSAGDVDFTPNGYAVFREVVEHVFGRDHIMYNDSGFRFDEAVRQFLVLAPNQELCERRLREIASNPEVYSGLAERSLAAITGPHAIATWKPNRFIDLDSGFRAVAELR